MSRDRKRAGIPLVVTEYQCGCGTIVRLWPAPGQVRASQKERKCPACLREMLKRPHTQRSLFDNPEQSE